MNTKERRFIASILIAIVVMVTTDLITDSSEGVQWWHLLIEGTIALVALIGVFLLIRESYALRHSLADEKRISSQFQAEAEKWRSLSKKYFEGLSRAIDDQLSLWHLTTSEKEIAFLLLKGLSLKEIAEIRRTTEKTARAQSISIYSKASLSGRSELAAFFLEDLLLPSGNHESKEGFSRPR